VPTTPRAAGVAARFGTEVHALVEARMAGHAYAPNGTEEEAHARQAICWIEDCVIGFGDSPIFSERGFVYDAANDAAAWGPRRGEPGYDTLDNADESDESDESEQAAKHAKPPRKPPHSIRGTIDLAWVADSTLHVVDIKTGKTANAHAEQLHIQALALSRILGITSVRVGFLFTRKTKVIPPVWAVLDADRLNEEAGRLHRLLRTLPQAQAVRNDGCRWCEVAPQDCPAINVDTVME
jgi:hypothetical protein